MSRAANVAGLLLCGSALAGCGTELFDLAIDVKTDLTPGIEFVAVRDTLRHERTDDRLTSAALLGDPFETGQRVAEYGALTAGDYTLTTELLDALGTVVVRRTTQIVLRQSVALTVLVSRECRGVTCPGAGDPPERTTCSGTHCVDPRCGPDMPEACISECSTGVDCTPRAACARATCVAGVCLYADGGSCGPRERCDVDLGCVPLPGECTAPLVGCRAGSVTVCVDTDRDPTSCGRCANVCPTADGAAPTCSGGVCGVVCLPGFFHCGDACAPTPCPTTFATAGTHAYTVPSNCTMLAVRAWGAGGGDSPGTNTAGAGGFAYARLAVTPGEALTVVVGSAGQTTTGGAAGGAGGVPGGGAGGGASRGGGGGGGFSGVFRAAISQAGALLIAGGGAGAGAGGAGVRYAGAGGGASGQDGDGGGGTQTAGGALNGNGSAGTALMGGAGGTQLDGGGGGGGGYFGGGGGTGQNSDAGSGGGGSGFVTGLDAVLAAGDRTTPANAGDPARGTAGDPRQPGSVIVACQ